MTEGRVLGQAKSPILAYIRKPGVDYSEVDRPTASSQSLSVGTAAATAASSTAPVSSPYPAALPAEARVDPSDPLATPDSAAGLAIPPASAAVVEP